MYTSMHSKYIYYQFMRKRSTVIGNIPLKCAILYQGKHGCSKVTGHLRCYHDLPLSLSTSYIPCNSFALNYSGVCLLQSPLLSLLNSAMIYVATQSSITRPLGLVNSTATGVQTSHDLSIPKLITNSSQTNTIPLGT